MDQIPTNGTPVLLSAGHEPSINPKDPCELRWGQWSITASCASYPAALGEMNEEYRAGGGLTYIVSLEFHGHQDGGENGLYGKLETSGCWASLENAAEEAKRFSPVLTSRCAGEDTEAEDECQRKLDLSGIIDAAVARMRAALRHETGT